MELYDNHFRCMEVNPGGGMIFTKNLKFEKVYIFITYNFFMLLLLHRV